MRFKSLLKTIIKVLVIFFAIVGIIFTGVFLAMQFGIFNVRGSIADRNKFFTDIDQSQILKNQNVEIQRSIIACESKAISKYDQNLGADILLAWGEKGDVIISSSMINNAIFQIAVANPEIKQEIYLCPKNTDGHIPLQSVYPWANTSDWNVITDGLIKDSSIINQVSKETNVSDRLIISGVVPEQFRFFSANRESYKRYFEPLKILGTLSKFSLGISGVKPDTDTEIERNLTDNTSPFYPGGAYEHLLDYPIGSDHDTEQYNRLTDTKNHYYQYLYTALYIAEIKAQWLNAGYDLSYRPDILSTLFNLGFAHSIPSDHPEVGGAVISINNQNISFGELGSEFYFSGILVEQFSY